MINNMLGSRVQKATKQSESYGAILMNKLREETNKVPQERKSDSTHR